MICQESIEEAYCSFASAVTSGSFSQIAFGLQFGGEIN